MKVAVTGASGLIGTALRRRLESAGHHVLAVVRRPVAEGEAAVHWNPAAGRLEATDLAGVDAVVNLAGAGIGDRRWTEGRKRELLESRTRGTELLASALASLEPKPSVLISGSAIGYYGDRGDEVLTEQSPPGDDYLAAICVAWEAATATASAAGIRVATIRTGVVLSTEGGALPRLLPLFKRGLGGRFGSGRQWWSWIGLDDEIDAICWLLDHDVSGPVNLTSPEPATNAQLTRALGQVLHRPARLPVPRFGPRLVVGSELADALLFTSARVQPTVLERSGYEFHHPDLDGALRAALT